MKLNPKTAQRQWARKLKPEGAKEEKERMTMQMFFNPFTGSKWETIRNRFFTGRTAMRANPKSAS